MAKQNAAVAPREDKTSGPSRSSGLVAWFAGKYNVQPENMLQTLKDTAFRQRGKGGGPPPSISNEQMMMLLIVAKKYDLDPFTKQIYAFPSEGGIVPVVGIDGWIGLINAHPQHLGMEIEYAQDDAEDPWIEVIIHRKDRSHPIRIREYLSECRRNTDPWNSMPRRMLRHKAIAQCGRVAYGFANIHDPDEADRILAARDVVMEVPQIGKPSTARPQARQEEPPAQHPERITMDQATWLADMIKEEGIELNAFLAKMEIGAIEEIAHGDFAKAKAAIEELGAA